MRIRTLSIPAALFALTGVAYAHDGTMAHAHPHPDLGLVLAAGVIFVAATALVRAMLRPGKRLIRSRSRRDDSR